MYLTLLACALKNGKDGKHMLHRVYHNIFKKPPQSSSMCLVPITSPSLLSKLTTILTFLKFLYNFITQVCIPRHYNVILCVCVFKS